MIQYMDMLLTLVNDVPQTQFLFAGGGPGVNEATSILSQLLVMAYSVLSEQSVMDARRAFLYEYFAPMMAD